MEKLTLWERVFIDLLRELSPQQQQDLLRIMEAFRRAK